MKVLLVTWDCGGNVAPFLGLGAELAARGHDVSCLGAPSLQNRFRSEGVNYRSFTRATFDPVERIEPLESRALFDKMFFGDDIAQDFVSVCRDVQPQVVVVDFCLVSVISVAESMGLTVWILAHTLPGCIFPLWEARGLASSIDLTRSRYNLPPLRKMSDLWASCAGVLATTARELDGPELKDFASINYTGPIFEPTGEAKTPNLPPLEDGVHLVLISFSTTFMDQEPLLNRVLSAVSEMPWIHGIVTAGPSVDPACLERFSNISSFSYVPHSVLLPMVKAAILHGGHTSVSKALSYGVPVMCVPQGRDQFYVSERVQSLGIGITVSKDAEAGHYKAGLQKLLEDDRYATNCLAFSRSMMVGGAGASNAADALLAATTSASAVVPALRGKDRASFGSDVI